MSRQCPQCYTINEFEISEEIGREICSRCKQPVETIPPVVDKDCFDSCQIEQCQAYGVDRFPPKFCLADPVVDRYEKKKVRNLPKPCDTCAHPDSVDRCKRCSSFFKKREQVNK